MRRSSGDSHYLELAFVVSATSAVMMSADPPADPPPVLAGKKLVLVFRCPKGKCW